MRIAVVSKFPPSIEGVTEYAWHVVQSIAARPEIERITVIANHELARCSSVQVDQTCYSASVPLEIRRVWRVGEARLAVRVLREIARLHPDVVWYNVGLSMFGGAPLAASAFLLPAITRRLGIRSIVTLHEQRIDQLADLGVPDGAHRRLGLRAAIGALLLSDVVCVTSERHRRDLERYRLPGCAQIAYLPLCGYDAPGYEPAQDTATVLMLTSHAPHKGLSTLIRAFRSVRQHLPHARLAVAGIDHPRFPGFLQSVRREYGAEPGIEWVGPLPAEQVRPTMCRATIVVVPYDVATGSSATIHQATGVGRPVVASDLAEFRAMAEEENLWLEYFHRGDPTCLANALLKLLISPLRRQEIAQHNLVSAQRNSLVATTDRYVKMFESPHSSRERAPVSGRPYGALSR